MRRIIRFLALLSVVAGVHFFNVLEVVEHELMELRYRSTTIPAATNLVVVEIDEPSLRELAVWPWPRRYYAEVIEKLAAAGSKRIAIDIDFSSHAAPADDKRLAEVLKNVGLPIILAVFRQAVHHSDGTIEIAESRPIEAFARHASLAAFNVRPEADGKVRQLSTRENWNGRIVPHYAALVAGRHGGRMLNYYVNYSLDIATLPRLRFADVLAGRFDPAIVRGRDVVIGATAVQLGDMVTVPVYRSIPGVLLQALGQATLAKNVAIQRIHPGLAVAVAVALLVLLQLVPGAAGWRASLAASGGAIGLILLINLGVVWRFGFYLDSMPMLLVAILDFLSRSLIRLKRQDIQLLVQSVALRRRDMFMRLIVENSFDAIFTIDPDGNVLTYNHAAEEVFGYDRDDVIGQSLSHMMPDLHIAGDARGLKDLLELRGLHEIECRHVDGHPLILDLSIGQVMADNQLVIVCLARDITEKRSAEDHARAVEQQMFESLESVQEGVALFDAEDHLVIANRRFREISHDTIANTGGRPTFEDILRPLAKSGYYKSATADTEAWLSDRLARHRDPGAPITDETADGKWVLTSERRTADGGTIVVETDITTLKQREGELVKARDEAEVANRMKSEFLAAMSHELRTPLNAIIGFSEMMSTEAFGPLGSEQYRGYVSDIHGSGSRLLAIINDILDMAKIESGQFSLREDDMSLNEAAKGVLRAVEKSPERKGKELLIEANLPDATIGLHADPRVVRQIMTNLLSNAVKFTPDGGRINVAIARREDGSVAVEIRDTGIGMSPEDIIKALQPFVQVQGALSREYEGTGLGLSLVKKLTELHGGEIEIESTPGEGTTVRVIFPVARALAPRRAAKGVA